MDKLKHTPSNGSNFKTTKQNLEQKQATHEIPIIKPSTKTVDIEFLHKIIFDINSKLDSNVYWLTTLLQNIILSIETLNSKADSLDKRLTIIENSKVNENTIKIRDENFKLKNSINEDIKDNDDDDDNDEDDCINEIKNKVVLRRRTTIQIANDNKRTNSTAGNSNFNRNNRLSQPIIDNNDIKTKQYRYSTPQSTVQLVKANINKVKPSPFITRPLSPIEAFKTNNNKNIINFNDLPILDYKNSSSTNSGTSAKASDIENTQKNSSSVNLKTEIKATDTDQDSLDNFIDIVVENSDSELLYNQKETKLGINFDTNEILNLKIINKSSKEDVMHNNNKNNSENRIVKRFKILKDGPFEFVLDIVDGNLVVMEIFDGGIIQRHGGIKVGDYLVAANGLKLNGKTFNEAQLRLEKAMEDDSEYIELIVMRGSDQDDEEITAL